MGVLVDVALENVAVIAEPEPAAFVFCLLLFKTQFKLVNKKRYSKTLNPKKTLNICINFCANPCKIHHFYCWMKNSYKYESYLERMIHSSTNTNQILNYLNIYIASRDQNSARYSSTCNLAKSGVPTSLYYIICNGDLFIF